MKILFSGGGTLGSVTPLIAIIDYIKEHYPKDEIFWVSTKDGIEKKFFQDANIKFYSIHSAKLRRYFSLQNFVDIFKFIWSLFEASKILDEVQPDILFSAGAYVSVPLVIMGKLKGKKIIIHQQDVKVGLANKIMSRLADKITVSFPESKYKFKRKVKLTGNPCRFHGYIKPSNKNRILNKYNLKENKAILLILGGSSGSQRLNQAIYNNISDLTGKFQVLHVLGIKKGKKIKSRDYHQYNFLQDKVFDFMYLADMVVSRAGLATLTELSFLKKCVILVPLKGHQEINAGYFYEHKAVEVSHPDDLVENIFKLSKDKAKIKTLRENISKILPAQGTKNVVQEIYKLVRNRK